MPLQQVFNAQASSANAAFGVTPPGGPVSLVAQGTFGGGTVKIQASADNGTTWLDVAGSSLTANGMLPNLILQSGLSYRVALVGATAPSVSAWIAGP